MNPNEINVGDYAEPQLFGDMPLDDNNLSTGGVIINPDSETTV